MSGRSDWKELLLHLPLPEKLFRKPLVPLGQTSQFTSRALGEQGGLTKRKPRSPGSQHLTAKSEHGIHSLSQAVMAHCSFHYPRNAIKKLKGWGLCCDWCGHSQRVARPPFPSPHRRKGHCGSSTLGPFRPQKSTLKLTELSQSRT